MRSWAWVQRRGGTSSHSGLLRPFAMQGCTVCAGWECSLGSDTTAEVGHTHAASDSWGRFAGKEEQREEEGKLGGAIQANGKGRAEKGARPTPPLPSTFVCRLQGEALG